MVYHFGLRFRGDKNDLKINIRNFVGKRRDGGYYYKSKECRSWFESNPEQLKSFLDSAELNYKLNMLYYRSLSWEDFDFHVSSFVNNHIGFEHIEDLNLCRSPGLYLMVLDDYKQVYIGITEKQTIKDRIRQHWDSRFFLDRILFGSPYQSRLPIDSFKALDTTRVYALQSTNLSDSERCMVMEFPDQYLCNRTAGGNLNGGLGEAIANRKPGRDLKQFAPLLNDYEFLVAQRTE